MGKGDKVWTHQDLKWQTFLAQSLLSDVISAIKGSDQSGEMNLWECSA